MSLKALVIDEDTDYGHPKIFKVVLKNLRAVPRPTVKEFNQMKHSLKTDGQQEPIMVNQFLEIVDGHTRYKILKAIGQRIYYKKKFFADAYAEIKFSIRANLHRRHLHPLQKVILYKDLYDQEKKRARERIKQGLEHSKLIRSGKSTKEEIQQKIRDHSFVDEDGLGSTAQHFGKLVGVATSTVNTGRYIMAHTSEKQQNEVLSGRRTMTDLYNAAKKKHHQGRNLDHKYYMITIQKLNASHNPIGSPWKTVKKLRPTRISALQTYIRLMRH